MITGQLSKPLLSLRSEMSAAELRADDKAPASPDSELNDDPLLLSSDANDREDTPNKLYGAREGSVQSDASSSPSEQGGLGQSHPAYSVGPQSLLVAQQLANAVGGVMSGAAPGLNQPILIPFNAGGHLGGQQGLVLSLPTTNIQGLVAAAAAGGLMSLPLQNLQDPSGHKAPLPSSLSGLITALLNEACWHSASVSTMDQSAPSMTSGASVFNSQARC
ncbi:POU domain, class 6, transcription factor 2-like [Osmerus eperlanus]|uniref:POU domain, class 6, transcription factor 2-like n=1 Tax=Osmerus eperlanus TaxID=29151 RepID=UPI002E15F4B2